MASDKEKIAALKSKLYKIYDLLDVLYDEYKKPKYFRALGSNVPVGIAEQAGVINAEEQAYLDELNERAGWIDVELQKLEGIDPDDKIGKDMIEEHDSEEYIDLADSKYKEDFKKELQEKVQDTGTKLSDYLSHMNRDEASGGLSLETCLDILEKIVTKVNPEVGAFIGTARFVAKVVQEVYKSVSPKTGIDSYQYVTNLQKSLKGYIAKDDEFYEFTKGFAKIQKIILNNTASFADHTEYETAKKKFIDGFMNENDVKTDLIRYLAQHQSEGGSVFPNMLNYSTGTVVVEYNYDKDSKKFEFDGGHIDDLGDDLKKILRHDRGDDAVIDLPLKIELRIDTTLLGKDIQAERNNDTPGSTSFKMTFMGEEDYKVAEQIVAEFVKANPLKQLKISQIL